MLFSILLLIFIISYLVGSIPSGYIIAKFHNIDITKVGSGATGTTNVLRVLDKKWAIIVLLMDLFKGFILIKIISCIFIYNPFIDHSEIFLDFFKLDFKLNMLGGVIVSLHRWGESAFIMFTYLYIILPCAFLCLVGHCYSVWIGFKGGKAVATFMGILLAMHPLTAIFSILVWGLSLFITKISSLSSLLAVFSSVLGYFILTHNFDWFSIYLIISILLVFWTHRENIKRLLNGTEPKINVKK